MLKPDVNLPLCFSFELSVDMLDYMDDILALQAQGLYCVTT